MLIMSNSFTSFYKRVADAAGITSLSELADILGLNRSSITQARKKDAIPATWLLQLFRRYGLNPDWLEKGREPKYLRPELDNDAAFHTIAKVEARLCAGAGSFDVSSQTVGHFSFRKSWLRAKGQASQMVLMDVFGNSMTPEIKDGDMVLVDQSQRNILAGAIYAVGIEDTIMVKRIEKHPRKLVLLSDNKAYAPIFLTGEEIDSVRIIGKVIWIGRELR
jgi:phage repressor protein C with HTH and peptisase S24 domain